MERKRYNDIYESKYDSRYNYYDSRQEKNDSDRSKYDSDKSHKYIDFETAVMMQRNRGCRACRK